MSPDHPAWNENVPDTFQVAFSTTKGEFIIETITAWSPIGAKRFYHLVKNGFFDDSRFFRIRAGFIAQFGIPGDPKITKHWATRSMKDDPVKQSNKRGYVSYAMTGPDTRTTQIYINYIDNSRLDSQGFSPFGKVTQGMDIIDQLYSEYDESAGGGMRLGKQQKMLELGNEHLDRNFPKLDRLIKAIIIE